MRCLYEPRSAAAGVAEPVATHIWAHINVKSTNFVLLILVVLLVLQKFGLAGFTFPEMSLEYVGSREAIVAYFARVRSVTSIYNVVSTNRVSNRAYLRRSICRNKCYGRR